MHNIVKPTEETRERVTILSEKDLEISYFCGSGHGGQARNKVASGVLIRHLESGASGRASDSRSQHDNKMAAFQRLVKDPRMKFWIAKKVYEVRAGEKIEQEIERVARAENCRFEVRQNNKWTEVKDSYFETAEAKCGQ